MVYKVWPWVCIFSRVIFEPSASGLMKAKRAKKNLMCKDHTRQSFLGGLQGLKLGNNEYIACPGFVEMGGRADGRTGCFQKKKLHFFGNDVELDRIIDITTVIME